MVDKKNPAAVVLGKLRWKGKSKEERRAHSKKMLDARWYLRRENGYKSTRDVNPDLLDKPGKE